MSNQQVMSHILSWSLSRVQSVSWEAGNTQDRDLPLLNTYGFKPYQGPLANGPSDTPTDPHTLRSPDGWRVRLEFSLVDSWYYCAERVVRRGGLTSWTGGPPVELLGDADSRAMTTGAERPEDDVALSRTLCEALDVRPYGPRIRSDALDQRNEPWTVDIWRERGG
jgi:hypothetical protein